MANLPGEVACGEVLPGYLPKGASAPCVDGGFHAPLLPRPPQGDLPPNTPTAPPFVAGPPIGWQHQLTAATPRGIFHTWQGDAPSWRAGDSILETPGFASFWCDRRNCVPPFDSNEPESLIVTDTPTGSPTRVR